MKKYNPGHYIQNKSANSADPADLAPALLPGFRGAMVDIPWAAVEPARGEYDFAIIENYLAWGERNDRRLIFMLFDRDFNQNAARSQIVPRWLSEMGLSVPFNAQKGNRGTIAKIWLPVVTDYRAALIAAIARRFDDYPHLEAIALPETAPGGVSPANTPDYSREAYRDELIRLIRSVAPALLNTQLWQSMNWLGPADGSYLDLIAAAIEETGAGGITNPDSVPWEAEQKPMYGTMRRFAGRIAVCVGGDTSQLLNPEANGEYANLAELVQRQWAFARELGGNYQLWNSWFTNRDTPDGRHSAGYRAAIAALVADPACGTIADVPAALADREPPAEKPAVDRAAVLAWLDEAEDLPGQLRDWLAKGRVLVG